MEKEVVYPCETPGCKTEGPADRMYTLDQCVTKGKRVVVCGPCGLLARGEDIQTFKLSETLKRAAVRQQKRGYFKSLRTAMKVAERKEAKSAQPVAR